MENQKQTCLYCGKFSPNGILCSPECEKRHCRFERNKKVDRLCHILCFAVGLMSIPVCVLPYDKATVLLTVEGVLGIGVCILTIVFPYSNRENLCEKDAESGQRIRNVIWLLLLLLILAIGSDLMVKFRYRH